MDKQNVVYQYNAVLFGNIMELSTYTYYNMNKPKNVMLNERSQTQKAKGHRLRFHLYEIPRIRKSTDRK